MSAETDDIEVFKRFLDMTAKKYAEIDSDKDRSMQFFDEVTALFEEYLAQSSLEDAPETDALPFLRRWVTRIHRSIALLAYSAKYGTLPLRNRLTEAFLAGLEKQKKINPGDRRTLNVHQVINFSDDGSCTAALAPKEAYVKAKRSLVVVGVLTLMTLGLVWIALSQFWVAIPVCYTLGAILGWLWRDAFDSAWGRDRLAKRLGLQLPFLKLQKT